MLTSIGQLEPRVEAPAVEDSDVEEDFDTETIVNKTYIDSDSDTISYQETNLDCEHYNWDETETIEHIMRKSDRQVKRKCSLDYDDL